MQKASTTSRRPKTSSSNAKASSAKESTAATCAPSASLVQPQKPAIPAGFFDDSLADAMARNVNVQQLAKKQLEADWEQFEKFAAEVEQQSVKEKEVQKEETKEREAVEQLENMQYVDRYRMALERVTSLRNKGKAKTTKRRMEDSADDVGEEDGEAESSNSATMAVNEYKKKYKKKLKKHQESDSDESAELDPCDWRSRGV